MIFIFFMLDMNNIYSKFFNLYGIPKYDQYEVLINIYVWNILLFQMDNNYMQNIYIYIFTVILYNYYRFIIYNYHCIYLYMYFALYYQQY